MDENSKELLAQVLAAMEEQTQTLERMIDKRGDEIEARINMKIEHEVSRKIEALFDGYKLVHERQWEQERENRRLAARLDDIEARLLALESKTA